MEEPRLKYHMLGRINLTFVVALFFMMLSHWLGYDQFFYFDSLVITLLVPFSFVLLYVLGKQYIREDHYQVVLNALMWMTCILTIDIAFLSGVYQFIGSHIILLIITVYCINEKKLMNLFVELYIIFVYPVLILSSVDLSKKIMAITAMSVVLFLGKLKNYYDELLLQTLASTSDAKNKILDNAKEAFAIHRMIFDEKGKAVDYEFIDINKSFEETLGFEKEAIISKTVMEVFPKTEQHWLDFYEMVVKEQKQQSMINYSQEFDQYFEVSAYPVGEEEFAVLFTDVTEEVKSKQQLRLSAIRLEKANKLKTRFLRDVNHRLRTPLNGMMGMLQLIDVDDMNQDNKELFDAMVLEMRHTRNIINQIAKYIDIQNLDYTYAQGVVKELIDDVIGPFKDKGFEITVYYEAGLAIKSYFLELSIFESILTELLRNAVKHTRNKRIDLEVKDQQGTGKVNTLSITVKDYGKGMTQDNLEYLFNEFYHDDFINIYRDESMLSLPMCKQILDNCGGDIYASSEHGKWMKVTMELPYYLQLN